MFICILYDEIKTVTVMKQIIQKPDLSNDCLINNQANLDFIFVLYKVQLIHFVITCAGGREVPLGTIDMQL